MPPVPRTGRRPDPATRKRWQQRLDRFRRSGLSIPAFCDREGVSAASFYSWRRRLQVDAAPPDADKARVIPVHLVSQPRAAPLQVVLPSGLSFRLSPDHDLAWLRQVLPLLGVRPC